MMKKLGDNESLTIRFVLQNDENNGRRRYNNNNEFNFRTLNEN